MNTETRGNEMNKEQVLDIVKDIIANATKTGADYMLRFGGTNNCYTANYWVTQMLNNEGIYTDWVKCTYTEMNLGHAVALVEGSIVVDVANIDVLGARTWDLVDYITEQNMANAVPYDVKTAGEVVHKEHLNII